MPSAFARRTIVPVALLLTGLLGALPAHAQLSQNMQDWMRRINSGEFSAGGGRGAGGGGRGGRGGGAGRWMDGGKAYVISEAASGGGMQSVRIDTATGAPQGGVAGADAAAAPAGGWMAGRPTSSAKRRAAAACRVCASLGLPVRGRFCRRSRPILRPEAAGDRKRAHRPTAPGCCSAPTGTRS